MFDHLLVLALKGLKSISYKNFLNYCTSFLRTSQARKTSRTTLTYNDLQMSHVIAIYTALKKLKPDLHLINICQEIEPHRLLFLFLGPAGLLSQAGNYMFKVNNRNNRTRCEICSKLTINTPERSYSL